MSFARTLFVALVFAPSLLTAQQKVAATRGSGAALHAVRAPSATVAVAVRAEKAPIIDGKADDAIWATAQVFDAFRTFEPVENGDPRFRTEARAAYDDRNLYVLVRAFDPHPDSIIKILERRDTFTPSDMI